LNSISKFPPATQSGNAAFAEFLIIGIILPPAFYFLSRDQIPFGLSAHDASRWHLFGNQRR
jgi:hypothetical protein